MTRKLAKWVSKRGQTAEIRPSVLVGGNSFRAYPVVTHTHYMLGVH